MVAHGKTSGVASATPRLSLSASPQVSAAADVHEFSLIEGDVQIESGATIAPGSAVTAGQGASVLMDVQCRLLPGVIVEAIAGPQVMLASIGNEPRSIYLGERSVVAHKALIHSPAYIGKGCFVGFRSTIFNARLGEGCVVMMHALVQDVEVPPGRCVPSGAVINAQHQADQLPVVRPEDLELIKEVVGQSSARSGGSSNNSSSDSYRSDRTKSRLVSVHSSSNARHSSSSRPYISQGISQDISQDTEGANMQAQRLSPEIVQKVRQHLGQGYRIGMEHADKRRYRSGVWETCTPIKDTREQAVFEALERCLAEHQGEYVRMFGIDPAVKQRVGMVTVQRPGDKPVAASGGSNNGSYSGGYSAQSSYRNNGNNNGSSGAQGGGALTSGVAQEVRNLLNAGYTIGTEHAGPRHYSSNVWKVCSPIESRNEREVFSHLEHCLDEHSGEYVRMFGIDPKANSRTATTTIQRADGKPVEVDARPVPAASGAPQQSSSYSTQSYESSGAQGSGGGEVAQAVSQIIRGGNKIGMEFADKRRYRSGIWQTAPSINATNEAAANKQLQSFLSQHSDKYVRIFSVNGQRKTRGSATTIQKPGQPASQGSGSSNSDVTTNGREAARSPINENPPHYDDPAYLNRSGGRSGGQSGGMDDTVMNQITQLVNQGLKISVEFADKRRYRSGIWKTGPSINARRPAEAISELGKQLARHEGEYVRLIGTDTQAKRRVMEVTIQRPGQPNGQSSSQSGYRSNGRDPINANPPHYDDPSFRGQPSSYGQSGGYNSNGQQGGNNGNGSMASGVLDQVTQLVNQGHKISLEYADKRRYRSGIWKTGGAIAARRPAEAISELGKQLARHQGEYVRLVGTDTQAKRRVLEATIQRP